MKKVLFITYVFPPMAGGGVYRVVKTLKHLPLLKWTPIILTVKNFDHWILDNTLCNELPPNLKIFHSYAIDPFYLHIFLEKIGLKRLQKFIDRYLFVPDSKIGWLPTAFLRGLQLIKNEKIDLIFSTSPPHSTHLIAYLLKKITKIPWIAEFRDPFSLNIEGQHNPTIRKKLEKNIEKKILTAANKIITISEPDRRDLLKEFGLLENKVITITNGYDEDDFKDLIEPYIDYKKFSIVYAGTFYGARSPDPVFLAIKSLLKKNRELQQRVEMNIIGRMEDAFASLIKKRGIESVVKLLGYFNHKETLRHMKKAHLLLLVTSHGKGNIPGKIFEYMASGTPILALVPDGIAKQLIEESRTGFTVDPDNAEAISEKIYELYQKWECGELRISPNWDVIKRYERKSLIQTLAAEFDKVLL